MRLTRTAALVGLASLAVAGAAWAAEKPAKPHVQTMEVKLPDGGVARIRYSGDVAPEVGFGRTAMDALPDGLDPAPFAAMDRIMADMDLQAAQMLREVQDMQLRMAAAPNAGGGGKPGEMQWVSLPGFGPAGGPIAVTALPPGAVSYSSVTRISGGRACTETVQVTRTSADAAPQVVRRASGDCGSAADPAPSSAPAAAAPAAPAARMIAAPKPAAPPAPPPKPRDII